MFYVWRKRSDKTKETRWTLESQELNVARVRIGPTLSSVALDKIIKGKLCYWRIFVLRGLGGVFDGAFPPLAPLTIP